MGQQLTAFGKPVIRLAAGDYLPWAHHPHCERYAHHLLWFRGRPLCLGCTAMSFGAAIGVIATLLVDWQSISWTRWAGIHLAALLPTALQPRVQYKAFKIGSRTALGAATTSYWASGLLGVDPPAPFAAWMLLMVGAFAGMFALLRRIRNRVPDDPCAACPLGVYPTCEWNLPRLLGDPALDPDMVMALRSHSIPNVPETTVAGASLERNTTPRSSEPCRC